MSKEKDIVEVKVRLDKVKILRFVYLVVFPGLIVAYELLSSMFFYGLLHMRVRLILSLVVVYYLVIGVMVFYYWIHGWLLHKYKTMKHGDILYHGFKLFYIAASMLAMIYIVTQLVARGTRLDDAVIIGIVIGIGLVYIPFTKGLVMALKGTRWLT